VESTAVGGVTSFDSNGWTMGNDGDINGSSNTFVGWAWDGGSEARYSPGLSGTDLRSAYLAFESGSNLNDYDRVARLPGVGTITWTAGNNIEPIGNVTNLDLYIYQNDSIDTVSFTINGSSATPSSTIRTPSNPYGIYGYRFAVSATVSSFSFTNSSASARLKRVSADGVDLTESINTNGSIPAAVNANASAGFSIVSYTGTGSNATVGHGLNAAPEFMFLKNRDGTQNWQVYHSSIGPTKYLNITTAAAFTNSNRWQDTAPTSSVFSIGTAPGLNTSTARIIAYCFAPVEGYSSFGSYVGNGSADGPFVYTGFSPRWIMTKPSSAVGDWMLWDTARHPSNTNDATLSPNTNAADTDGAGYDVDILSNGFKLREFGSSSNASGVTYLYACFSENPFRTARAR
jgi:hypothetical protein